MPAQQQLYRYSRPTTMTSVLFNLTIRRGKDSDGRFLPFNDTTRCRILESEKEGSNVFAACYYRLYASRFSRRPAFTTTATGKRYEGFFAISLTVCHC
mmetsp:Transcript_5627/g.11633  ORF Transcript_5627/g.11633 Transcript_5627/m.11633 type:complete len:98 (+) Transcript_5627:1052-1345(+)